MRFNELSARILVRGDYRVYFDFCTEKLGLIPVYGDRNGPYTNFTTKEGEPPCFAIFLGANTAMWKGYEQPKECMPADTIVAVIPSDDLDRDYKRLKEAGVQFLGEPQFIPEWGFRCTYFRDPEGNLFELNHNASV